jgi:membrane-associated protease RseP (regulator of RpoE activity)
LTAFKNDSKYLLESVSLLIDAIQSAGESRGWNPASSDKYSRAIACNQLANKLTTEKVNKLSNSPIFYEALTPVQRRVLGLIPDPQDFPLGVQIWMNNSLQLLDVSEDGLAYKLGFRSGDIITKVAGGQPLDLLAVKKALRQFAGREIKILVKRYSHFDEKWEDELLEIDVPRKLPD